MPDDTPNPDRAQVRDFGRENLWHTGDADVRRLQDEVAYLTAEVARLTRERDLWQGRAQISMSSPRGAA